MKAKIKLNKRKLQLLNGAVQSWQRSNSYLSIKYGGECDDLSVRLWGMHVCAPWGKEAKVKFTLSEVEALEYALTHELNAYPCAKSYEELRDLRELFEKFNLLLHIVE